MQRTEEPGKPQPIKWEPFIRFFKKRWKRWKLYWSPASARRLDDILPGAEAELKRLKARVSSDVPFWATSCENLLEKSRQALDTGDDEKGWRCFLAAQRMELRGLEQVDAAAFQARAKAIHQESLDKLRSWRKELTVALLGKQVEDDSQAGKGSRHYPPEAIHEAYVILHEHFHNEAIKRYSSKQQMEILTWIAWGLVFGWLGFLICCNLHRLGLSDPPLPTSDLLGSGRLAFGVVIFGLMGASLSGMLSLFKDPAQSKIPDMLLTFRITFARLIVGALCALAVEVALLSKFLKIGELNTDPAVLLLVAFACGFSERLVVSTLSKVA